MLNYFRKLNFLLFLKKFFRKWYNSSANLQMKTLNVFNSLSALPKKGSFSIIPPYLDAGGVGQFSYYC